MRCSFLTGPVKPGPIGLGPPLPDEVIRCLGARKDSCLMFRLRETQKQLMRTGTRSENPFMQLCDRSPYGHLRGYFEDLFVTRL